MLCTNPYCLPCCVWTVAATLVDGTDTVHGRWRGAREFVNYWSGPNAWASLSDRQHGRMARLTPKIAAEFGALMRSGVTPSSLAKLPMPVRMLCGTNTRRSARRIAELFADSNSGIRFEWLTGLGHMAPITNPEVVNPLLVDHIVWCASEPARNIRPERSAQWSRGGEEAVCVPDDGRSG